jgi:tripartite-type tricarboxylate transporter receptor subunit TctC
MQRVLVALVAFIVAMSMAAIGCSPSSSQATQFPEKGKPITVIVPLAAGGATDLSTRMLAELMAKDLGTPVQVVNKAGAGSQTGLTELTQAKPDGYTLSASPLPSAITTYLDPDRKSVYTAKSFQPVANLIFPPVVVNVRADSPYKTLDDLLAAAKAKPGALKIASAGIMSNNHLSILQMQKISGAQFSVVQFEGGAPAMTALLGGHVDVSVNVLPEVLSNFKNGSIRLLGITDKQESKFLPGVKTLESQGVKLYAYGSCGLVAPAGTPKNVVDILSKSVEKATKDQAFTSKMEEMGYPLQYMDADTYTKFWADLEASVAPIMNDAKAPQ